MCAPWTALALVCHCCPLGKARRWERGHPQAWPWSAQLQAMTFGTQAGVCWAAEDAWACWRAGAGQQDQAS